MKILHPDGARAVGAAAAYWMRIGPDLLAAAEAVIRCDDNGAYGDWMPPKRGKEMENLRKAVAQAKGA